MSNFVTVVKHPETGEIITQSANNPAWGTVRVDAPSVEFSNGIMNKRNRTAFIRGEIVNLKEMFKTDGQKIPGKIVRITSSQPFYAGQQPVSNPQTAEVVMKNGSPFYQNYVFTTNLSEFDREVEETPVAVGAGTATPVAGN